MKPNFDNLNMTFATTYNWGVEFVDSEVYLIKEGYTITGVTEELGVIQEKTWTVGHKVISIPHQVGQMSLSIDFTDTDRLYLFDYLDEWYNLFYDSLKKGSLSYNKVVRCVRVTKYTQTGEIVTSADYWIYPYGTLMYNGTSEAQLLTGKATFRVVKREVIK